MSMKKESVICERELQPSANLAYWANRYRERVKNRLALRDMLEDTDV